jgi:hypothetical protein
MAVQTVLETAAGQQVVLWNLVEQPPTAAEGTSRWRIESAQPIR